MLRRWIGIPLRALRELTTAERVVLLVVAVLHGACIGWGLPSSDAWDVDGIAPRDFLPGIVETYTPGHYFTYPPVHLELLALLTSPVTAFQIARAPSLAPSDLVATFLSVPVMTIFALVARLTSFVMSLGLVLIVGRISEAIFGARSARAWAMAVAGVEAAGTYYAHTTNLDLPALFWAASALAVLVGAVQADEPRQLRRGAILAALAIATKDQAYAVFAVTMPVVILAWLALRRPNERLVLVREAALCAAIVVGLVLVLDGALFNPRGFVARVHFLTGPASQDFAQHSRDLAGRVSAFVDAVTFFPNHYPVALAPVLAVGLGLVLSRARARGRDRVAALVPILAALSFTLAFNCVARRVEERFMMPQMQLVAVYAGGVGVAVSALRERSRPALARLAWAGGAVVVLLGLRLGLDVVVTMARDARYDAEHWIASHVRPGERVEVYGANVYLPRFPGGLTVERVDTRRARSPLPGVVEKEDRLGAVEVRRPRWIVVGQGFAWRYLQEDRAPQDGRILPETQRQNLADEDTRDYVRALFAERTAYRKAYVAHDAGSALFPARPLHASLATDVFIFERR